jgi:NAD(P)-dependent dehydrogenase (short-subunit alcohol dehydrogenase family)
VGSSDASSRFGGRAAIVTGAGSELGRGITYALLAEGARVVAVDDLEPVFPRLPREVAARCLAYATDVTDEVAVAQMLAEIAADWPPRHLFNAAGSGWSASLVDTTPEAWDRIQAVNVRATFVLCHHAIPLMAGAGGGSVVNVAPVVKSDVGPVGAAQWASRGAVVAFTRALAVELRSSAVRVNCVCPTIRPAGDPNRVLRAATASAIYLASDDASSLTGTSAAA